MLKRAANYLYPLFLFLYPFWNVNEGVDYMDVGYNIGNYAFWDHIGNIWKFSTYLSNQLGLFFYHLPYGDTLLGMNFYTTFLISILAVGGYFFTKRFVSSGFAFLGNFIAVSLCWCPTVKLYDYLTYVLMLAGVMTLYYGIKTEKKTLFVLAGFLLGVNVFTRLPNLSEAGFILLLWYACWLKKKTFRDTAGLTGICILGYLAGLLLFFFMICNDFGLEAYLSMLAGIGELESTGKDYSFFDLLTGAWRDYFRSFRYLLYFACYLAGGIILSKLKRIPFQKTIYLTGFLVLLRFLWGKGMFDLNYYSYGAMFWPTVIFLFASICLCVYRLVKKDTDQNEKILSMLVLLILLLTPLGSNNKSYPAMNNLFLVAPFILAWFYDLIKNAAFPYKGLVYAYFAFFFVQITLFGFIFTFGDGSYEEKRDTKIVNNDILNGMMTSANKAETVEDLTAYIQGLEGEVTAVAYGNIPSFCYYLNARPAMSGTWPFLDSFLVAELKRDLKQMAEQIKDSQGKVKPVFLLSTDLDQEDRKKEKFQLLEAFMKEYDYQLKVETSHVLLYH